MRRPQRAARSLWLILVCLGILTGSLLPQPSHAAGSEDPPRPSIPPNDHDNFHYFAVRIDADATTPRETLSERAHALGRQLNYHCLGRVGELRNYFLYATPKTVFIEGRGLAPHEPHVHVKRFSEVDDVAWVEPQIPKRRLFKRDVPQPEVESREQRAGPIRITETMKRLGIDDPGFKNQWHLINTEQIGNDLNVTAVWEQGITGHNATVCFLDDGLDYESEDLKANFFAEGSYDYNDHVKLPKPRLVDDRHGTRCAGEVAAGRNNVCGVGVAYDAKVSAVRILSGGLTQADEAAAINYEYQKNHIYSCSWGPSDNGQEMEAPPDIVMEAFTNGIQNGRGGLGSIYVFASGNGGNLFDNCPDLTWRDMQQLTVRTAIAISPTDPDWQRTAAGRLYSHKYGYGRLDGYRLVEAAKTYVKVNPQAHFKTDLTVVGKAIPQGKEGVTSQIIVTEDQLKRANFSRLEHITITVDIDHSMRGDVQVKLTSPHNVVSRLAVRRGYDVDFRGFPNWTFMSVAHWDENPVGAWALTVVDDVNPDRVGKWNHWWITFWGESGPLAVSGSQPAAPSPVTGQPTPSSTVLPPPATTTASSTTSSPAAATSQAKSLPAQTPDPTGTSSFSGGKIILGLGVFGAGIALAVFFFRRFRAGETRDKYEFQELNDEEVDAAFDDEDTGDEEMGYVHGAGGTGEGVAGSKAGAGGGTAGKEVIFDRFVVDDDDDEE
ncbi:pheromone processing endoprotease [Borealophlyctis nickersoniae]|nr:pheromone processing endoprotease [Borealophlyctis nickersoniae]